MRNKTADMYNEMKVNAMDEQSIERRFDAAMNMEVKEKVENETKVQITSICST